MILGDTGVGKDLLAELIHKVSKRKGDFFTVHLPALPETLFETELFGSRRGAFTDATERKKLIGEAEDGMLFFGEISDIPLNLNLQGKLLRFIDTGLYKRLGEDGERRANCEIISASNKDLVEEIKKGRFREDLYFRISANVYRMPPLKERKEDIEEMARIYLLKNGFEIDGKILNLLVVYDYPGNARELYSMLEKLKNGKNGFKITRKDVVK